MDKYDLIVIGAGPAGYPAAIRAAQLGASVALIEKEQAGGVCLNHGCIPTKTLIAAATLYQRLQQSDQHGVHTGKVSFDWAAMQGHKEKVVSGLRAGVENLLRANNITALKGSAAFQSRNRLGIQTSDGATRELEGGRVIIATGATPIALPQMPASPHIMDSRAFLALASLPKSLVIVGGGIIGCELACLAAQLNVEVTLLEKLPDIMAMLDDDTRRALRHAMESELGIKIICGQGLQAVNTTKTGLDLSIGDQTVKTEKLLIAVGRRPSTDGLQLQQAGVRVATSGLVITDEHGQTSAATVYAAGDVTGGPQLAHVATARGIAVAEHALGLRPARDSRTIPSAVFTSPEIGLVGLSEQEAAAQKRKILVGKFRYSALGRALAAGTLDGFVKLIADAQTGQLLGAQAIGAQATDLIAEATLAIQAEFTARDLAATIHAHPTYSEIWMEAARALNGECIHAPPRKLA